MQPDLDQATIAQKAVQLLEKLPLLRVKLARALFCGSDEVQSALEEVIKFLIVAASRSEQPATPSARVDLAWHEFILFTRTYQQFCDENFGKLIHHEPSDNHQENARQYAATLLSYQSLFGEPPQDFWSRPDQSGLHSAMAHCGNCETFKD